MTEVESLHRPTRIPPVFVDEVRAHASLAAIIGRDVKLKRAGRELQGCCPFHNERTPSFFVNDAKGMYHCFGCHASGDAVSYAMHRHRLGFADAVRMLADEAGLAMPDDGRSGCERQSERPRRTVAPLPAAPATDPEEAADMRRKHELALRIWREAVQPAGTPVAAYLASRGLCLPDSPARVLRYHPACPNGAIPCRP